MNTIILIIVIAALLVAALIVLLRSDLRGFTLARLKGIAAFLGSLLTYATTLDTFDLPGWVTGVAALLTFIATYAVPNAVVTPDGTADEDDDLEVDDPDDDYWDHAPKNPADPENAQPGDYEVDPPAEKPATAPPGALG